MAREFITSFSTDFQQAHLNGISDTTSAGFQALIEAQMSPVFSCAVGDTRCDTGYGPNDQVGYKMQNGLTFRLRGGDTTDYKFINVDIDGVGKGADTSGVDNFSLCTNLGDTVIGSPGVYNTSNWLEGLRPGEVRLCDNMAADGKYDWIYKD